MTEKHSYSFALTEKFSAVAHADNFVN